MDKFYSYDFNPVDIEEYAYKYYDAYDNERTIVVYVKSSIVVGVGCE